MSIKIFLERKNKNNNNSKVPSASPAKFWPFIMLMGKKHLTEVLIFISLFMGKVQHLFSRKFIYTDFFLSYTKFPHIFLGLFLDFQICYICLPINGLDPQSSLLKLYYKTGSEIFNKVKLSINPSTLPPNPATVLSCHLPRKVSHYFKY